VIPYGADYDDEGNRVDAADAFDQAHGDPDAPWPDDSTTSLSAAQPAALPGLKALLEELAQAESDAVRPRVHEVIRLLAHSASETRQEYRDAITGEGYISRGDWIEALSEAKKQTGRQQPQATRPGNGEAATTAALDITDEPDAVREITEAISNGALPDVYIRGQQLTHIATSDETARTRDLDDAILRRLIADHLPCTRLTKVGYVGALPLPMTCKAILALADWPKVPRLRGVTTYPVLLPDGAILQQEGYDSASQLYLHRGVAMEPVPERPGPELVARARSFLLDKYLADFPWVESDRGISADKANYLAMLLTPLLREIVRGLFPFFYITAPERGSGKTLLGILIQILYGASMRVLPKDDAEVRKVITASLRGSDPVIMFDNVPHDMTIDSASLAAVLTMPEWTDRILGGSRDGSWPNDRMWGATGTNVEVGGDFGQRTVRIALDYGKPHPDRRTGFRIPDIEEWTRASRGTVIRALLILASAWQAGGAPITSHVMRGFTPWARTLGGLLEFHEIPGFLANRDQIEVHDQDAEEWDGLLRVLHGAYGSIAQSARDILTDAASRPELRDALPSTKDGGPHNTRTLGKAMREHAGRWYAGGTLSLRNPGVNRENSQLWQIVTSEAAGANG
jgi:hypothetical protein